MSEVRGNSLEEPPHIRGQGRGPGGVTLRQRPGTAAGRSHPAPEARGGSQEDQPMSCAGERGPKGAIPR